jgi:hypothetical protein
VPIDILEMFFLPPLAIARVGGSNTPLESFRWVSDRGVYSAHRTIIEPAVTIVVDDDGTPLTYMPSAIRFRDGGKLRPVAPFFELWMRVKDGCREPADLLVTLELLKRLRVKPADLSFRITVANKKAQRRTQSTSCGFVARVDSRGNDHARKPLFAYSPTDPDHAPFSVRTCSGTAGKLPGSTTDSRLQPGCRPLSRARSLHPGKRRSLRSADRDRRNGLAPSGRRESGLGEGDAGPDARNRQTGKSHP